MALILTEVTRFVGQNGKEFRSRIDAEQFYKSAELQDAISASCAYDEMNSDSIFEFIQNKRGLIEEFYRLSDEMLAEVMGK